MSTHSSIFTKHSTPLTIRGPKVFKNDGELSLIMSLSSLIDDIIKKNLNKKIKSKKTIFYSENSKIPEISFFSYIYYIYSSLNLHFSTILLTLISIQRLLIRTKDQLSKNNFYKLFITSCLLNSKLNEECPYNCEIYSMIGKIDINELINLEREFFKMLDYKLYVNEEIYRRYYDLIKKRIIKRNENKNLNSL